MRKLKGTQPVVKMPTVCLAHLEEESVKKDEVVDSEDPDGIDGITEEFMVHLARAMKDAPNKEKCYYHCSSLNHFIHNCPLVKSLRMVSHLNCKEGQHQRREPWASQIKVTTSTMPSEGPTKV